MDSMTTEKHWNTVYEVRLDSAYQLNNASYAAILTIDVDDDDEHYTHIICGRYIKRRARPTLALTGDGQRRGCNGLVTRSANQPCRTSLSHRAIDVYVGRPSHPIIRPTDRRQQRQRWSHIGQHPTFARVTQAKWSRTPRGIIRRVSSDVISQGDERRDGNRT